MRVLITTKSHGTVDYTRYVVDGSLQIEDAINVPTLTSFQLANLDSLFVVPPRSSYVQIVSDVYANAGGYGTGGYGAGGYGSGSAIFAGGGYGSGKVLATGFITTELERTYLGLSNHAGRSTNNQMYTYNVLVTSDEWLLNCNTVPYIPAFVNQTDSQILASIAQALMPGFFNTTAMASGTLIPYFQYDPSQTWSDIAKTFADANRYHYKVLNQSLLYQPFGDYSLGISYDDQKQKEGFLDPNNLSTGLLTVPPVNDCTVIGDTEPQTNWTNYFIGDGFTSNFQLTHQVFQGTSATLLQDDWTEASFTQGTWTVNDPLTQCVLADGNGNALGALNIVQKGAPGVYTPQVNATYIEAQNGLELGGGLNLQHGSVVFNDTAVGGGGIIGAIYGSSTFTPGNCLAGFGVTGQANIGSFAGSVVSVPAANSQLVNITIPGIANPNVQPGCVFTAAGFIGAGFLNGSTQTVVSVSQLSPTQWQIVAQGSFVYSTTYGPTADSGTITFASNAVFVTASGAAGLVIQPIFNGQFVGPKIVTQVNHQYLLQTWIGAGAQTRFTRPYTNLTQTATYGNQNLAASGTISWVVTDVFLGNYVIEEQNPLFGLFPAAPPPAVTKFTEFGVNLPPFALYCLVNGIDLNVTINYTLLSLPPQGYLTVQSLTGMSGGNLPWLPSQLSVPIVYQLGFGQDNQSAQISAQGEAYSLSFYTDDIPSVGARIVFQSWSAGQSIARVTDPIAISNEASVSGDNGVRAAIMQNLSPLPRTSDECEAAAAAAILDREYPQFQGTYTIKTIPYKFENLLSPSTYGYPMPGRFLYINSPVRAVTGQNFYTNTVRTQVIELKQEVLSVSVDYGPDLYLEKLLPSFLERDQNILTPTQTVAAPNQITLPQVLNAHLPTLNNAQITSMVDSLTGNYVVVNLGAPPVTGCEVRSVDSGWGIAGQGRVGLFTTQVFTLPRTTRDQTWYLRTLNGSIFSRFSKALRVVYPLVPSAPALVSANSSTLVFDYAGDIRDIYGLELRAPGVTGIVALGGTSAVDNISAFERVLLPNNIFVGNNLAVYNPPGNPGFPPATGDIVLLTCPSNASYQGVRLINGLTTIVPSATTLNATSFTGNFASATVNGGNTNVTQNSATETWGGFPAGPNIPPLVLNVTASYTIISPGGASASVILQYSLNNGLSWINLLVGSTVGTAGGSYTVNLPTNQNMTQVLIRASVLAFGKVPPTVFMFVSGISITEGAPQNYQIMSWYDNGHSPQQVGVLDDQSGNVVGQAQIVSTTAPNSVTVSGSISTAGVGTVYTQAPHGYRNGAVIVVSCGYVGLIPNASGSIQTDGAPFCGLWTLIGTPTPTSFQFNFATNPSPGGLPIVPLTGLCAQVPVESTSTISGIGGVILQRPVFSPSDLVIDLTQPDIAEILELIEATAPNSRVTGLVGYFFNEQWDYSAGTSVPSFEVPSLTGIIIDSGTQQVSWAVATGLPSGYRVIITNALTNQVQNKFTVNHPYNPQLLTQFQMSTADFQAPVNISVTPFDAVGDGVGTTISWPGSGNTLGGGGSTEAYPAGVGAQLTSFDSALIDQLAFRSITAFTTGLAIGATATYLDAIIVHRVRVPMQITVSTFNFVLDATDVSVQSYTAFGIYSIDGNTKLIDTGSIVLPINVGSALVVSGSFAPVTLPVGEYWFAEAADASSITRVPEFLGLALTQFLVGSSPPLNQLYNLHTTQSVKIGLATNKISAGSAILPATLGPISFVPAISTGLQAISLVLVVFE